MENFESCGYCKECVRMRVLRAVGRTPETPLQCAYRHILDEYATPRPGAEPPGSDPPSPGGSCGSNCRWTSPGTSISFTKPSYDDMNFSDDYEFSPSFYRKRIKFVKRKKV